MNTTAKRSSEVPGRSRPFWTNGRREGFFGLIFVIPEVIGILVFGVFPLLFSLYLSFCEWNLVGGLSSIKFIGLDNFARILSDDKFYTALKNNALFTVVTVPVGMFMALVMAVLIHTKLYFKDFFKVAFFIPYISTQVALATIWAALLHPSLGPINNWLKSIGIADPPKWLGGTNSVMWAIIIISIWHAIGYKIIIYMAGLTNISNEVYEAADIDGANFYQKFFRVTLPLLGPTNFFLLITLIIGSFKVFDLIAFLTGGGPNSASTVLVYYIYEEGFQNFRMGYASALSWVLFIIVALLTMITWTSQKKNVHQ